MRPLAFCECGGLAQGTPWRPRFDGKPLSAFSCANSASHFWWDLLAPRKPSLGMEA